MPSVNHVLFLRHCIRSTKTTVKIHDGDHHAGAEPRERNISDYVKADLPDFGVPPMWCTENGLREISREGRHIVDEVVLGGRVAAGASPRGGEARVRIYLVSDESQRDVDTALALSRGMKRALAKSSAASSFGGVDLITLGHDIFSPEGGNERRGVDLDALCPRTEYNSTELNAQVMEELSKQMPESAYQDVVDLAVDLGAIDRESGPFSDRKEMGLQHELLREIAEMGFYSRASDISPPFLPGATNDDMLKLINVADRIRSGHGLDNIMAAKRGLVLAKSVMRALEERPDEDNAITVTIYVGHDSNIDHIATALGLRWVTEYQLEERSQTSSFVSTPPGSGMIFSRSPGDGNKVSMSYIYAKNLMERTSGEPSYEITPMFTHDEGRSRNEGGGGRLSEISVTALEGRLERTIERYPALRTCYLNSPVVYGETIRGRKEMGRDYSGRPSNASESLFVVSLACNFILLVSTVAYYMRSKILSRHSVAVEGYDQVRGSNIYERNPDEVETVEYDGAAYSRWTE